MDLNTRENRAILISGFSELAADPSFKINSPESKEYNCIAWAMGFDDRWVDPEDADYIHKKWWPEGVERSLEPEVLISAFKKLGFERCEDGCYVSDFDKVALYKGRYYNKLTGLFEEKIVWTHAAKIVGNNLYHSKIGESFDIYHSGRDLFRGTMYGTVYSYMQRSKANRIYTEKEKNKQVILPNDEAKERMIRQILEYMS